MKTTPIFYFLGLFAFSQISFGTVRISPDSRFHLNYETSMEITSVALAKDGENASGMMAVNANVNAVAAHSYWVVPVNGGAVTIYGGGMAQGVSTGIRADMATDGVGFLPEGSANERAPELSDSGWEGADLPTSLDTKSFPRVGARKDLFRMMADASLVRFGVLTPADFMAKSYPASFRSLREDILQDALFGTAKTLRMPFKMQLRMGGSIFDVLGNLLVAGIENPRSMFTIKNFKSRDAVEKNFSGYCSGSALDQIGVRFCRLVAGQLNRSSIDGYLFSGWKNSVELTARELTAVDGSGRSLLMRLVAQACGVEETRPASGFSSGESPLPAKKAQALERLSVTKVDVEAKDFFGRDSIDYALGFGCDWEVEWLLRKGGSLTGADFAGNRRVTYAIAGANEATVRKVLAAAAPAEFELPPSEEYAALQLARQGYETYLPVSKRSTPLGTAIVRKDARIIALVLARTPPLSAAQKDRLLSHLLPLRDEALLKVYLEMPVKPSAVDPNQWADSVLAFLKYDNAIPEIKKKHAGFYRMLDKIISSRKKAAATECAVDPVRRARMSDCFKKAGLCEKIPSSYLRDECYAFNRQCGKVSSDGWKWRCERERTPGRDVCGGLKDGDFEKSLCEFYGNKPDEILKAFRTLLATKRGAQKFAEAYGRYGVDLSRVDVEGLKSVCRSSNFLSTTNTRGLSIGDACANFYLRNISNREAYFKACNSIRPTEECDWIAAEMAKWSMSEVRDYLLARCEAKHLPSCVRLRSDVSAEGLAVAKRLCEKVGAPSQCIDASRFPGGGEFALAATIKLALEEDELALGALAQSSARNDLRVRELVEKNLSSFRRLCESHLSACRIIAFHSLLAPRPSSIEAIKPSVRKHMAWCLEREECIGLSEIVIAFPDLMKELTAACAKGYGGACLLAPMPKPNAGPVQTSTLPRATRVR